MTRGHGHAFTSPADPTKAQRRVKPPVPRVDYLTVPCFDCKAEVGSPCVSLGERQTPKGEPVQMFHRGRKRIATRRFNESRNSVNLPSESA